MYSQSPATQPATIAASSPAVQSETVNQEMPLKRLRDSRSRRARSLSSAAGTEVAPEEPRRSFCGLRCY